MSVGVWVERGKQQMDGAGGGQDAESALQPKVTQELVGWRRGEEKYGKKGRGAVVGKKLRQTKERVGDSHWEVRSAGSGVGWHQHLSPATPCRLQDQRLT